MVKQYPGIEVLDTQPADWDVTKVARLWETYLTKYPQIDAAFFHNDDMALAAYNVMKARNRTNILIGGVDAMPPAIAAVSDGRMFATVRNPSCRIHGGAIIAGVAAVTAGEKTGSRHSQEHRHRRSGGDQGERRRHAVDAGSLPDLRARSRHGLGPRGRRDAVRPFGGPARRSESDAPRRARRSHACEDAVPPLEMSGISKSFGGVAALRDVDFVLRARRDPRPGRRERRRQVDPDEDHRRRARPVSTAA